RDQLKTACWPAESYAAAALDDALKRGSAHVTDDAQSLLTHPGIEVIVEATGVPQAGIAHAMKAIANGKHVDWARACGFKVIAAGKGTRYEPHYHQSTPGNVWDILDKYLKITDRNSI